MINRRFKRDVHFKLIEDGPFVDLFSRFKCPPNEINIMRLFSRIHHNYDHNRDGRWKQASLRFNRAKFPDKGGVRYSNSYSCHRFL